MITKINSSNLARVMACKGSVFFKDLPQHERNEAAMDGITAAELLECLLNGVDPGDKTEKGVYYDDEMKFYIPLVAEQIKRDAQNNYIYAEQKVHWTTRSGISIRAKYDASFAIGDALYIDDLKYGYGIVEVEKNWQLLAYAIGEIINRGKYFPRIIMRIHQPRPFHEDGPTRSWEITYDELLEYKEQIEKRCDEIAAGQNELKTGRHCRYCPAAAGQCVAFNKLTYDAIEYSHEFIQDEIDNNGLASQLDLIDRISDILKTRKEALEQLAITRIKSGQVIPKYNCIDKYGNREWQPWVTPDVISTLAGGVNVRSNSMLSPNKVEKLGVPKKLIAQFTTRQFRGQKLNRSDVNKVASKIFGDKNE